MNTIINLFIALIPIAGLIGITASSVKQSRRGIPGKKILTRNLVGFMAVLVVCGILLAVFVIMFAPPADPGR